MTGWWRKIKEIDPGKLRDWGLLVAAICSIVGGAASAVYFNISVPSELEGIRQALVSLHRADSIARVERREADSANNLMHLRLQYELCEVQEIPIRDCIREE